MDLELVETVERLRAELADAAIAGAVKDIQFPVNSIQLELHIAVKKEAKAEAKVKVWVIEAGGSGALSREEVHKIIITLAAPIDREGRTIKIGQGSDQKP